MHPPSPTLNEGGWNGTIINILDVCQCRAEGNGPGEQRYSTGLGTCVIYMMIYMVIWIICILCLFISWQAAPEERDRIRSF